MRVVRLAKERDGTVKISFFKLNDPRQILVMGLAAVAVAIVRVIWWEYLVSLRGPFGFEALYIVCMPFALVVLVAFAGLAFLIIKSFRVSHNILPTVFLIFGLLMAFQIPLPAPPPTPEKLHFLKHEAMYEAVVTLARNNLLEQALPDCPAGFRPPEDMELVSAAGCMFVEHSDDQGLVVFFNPIEPFYHPIAYVEFDETEFPCGHDPHVEEKIEDHWYVCEREWN